MPECGILSVTETELIDKINCVQDMIYAKNVLNLIGLMIKLPIKIMMDNKGAKGIINNGSDSVKTRHVEDHFHCLK
jgi:hypothetical protein